MGNKNGKKEPKFLGETETIDLGNKKIGEKFSIYIRTNNSCGEGYHVINLDEFKKYLEFAEYSGQPLGEIHKMGASTSNSLSFKGIKTGTTCIKIEKTSITRSDKMEIYKVNIIE